MQQGWIVYVLYMSHGLLPACWWLENLTACLNTKHLASASLPIMMFARGSKAKGNKKPARNEPIAQTFKGSNLPVNSLAKTFAFEVRVYGHIQVRRIAMVLYGMVKLLLMSDFSKSLNIRVWFSNKIFKTDVTLTACSNTVYTPPSTNFLLPPWRKECKCKRKALKCQKPTTHFKIGVNLMLTRKVMAAW